jgi:hypothetical protein
MITEMRTVTPRLGHLRHSFFMREITLHVSGLCYDTDGENQQENQLKFELFLVNLFSGNIRKSVGH